jgi:aldehyde dehydrogenase family 7 protein A1
VGKIYKESEGEIQEAIDICDYAVGLSRKMSGEVLNSERPSHLLLHKYNPMDKHVGIVTAFNFPAAVFFWNTALSLVCGNTQIWKPAPTVPNISTACQLIVSEALTECGFDAGIATIFDSADNDVNEALVRDHRIGLLSFTGSTEVGLHLNKLVASRMDRTIMELGGNNAMIVDKDCDLDLAVSAAFFSAIGTNGQRCTSLRRLYLQEDIHHKFLDKLIDRYETIKYGDPMEEGVMVSRLHTQKQVYAFMNEIKAQKPNIIYGGNLMGENITQPSIVSRDHDASFEKTSKEIFAPILNVKTFKTFEEAVQLNNSAQHGLSSSLFTNNMQKVFEWIGEKGSDCGIVNVNTGPSGAEIGGAFGGNKLSGIGIESGGDAWKQYCKLSTCSINYSNHLPLSQGIEF